jgi:hypothetical protein
MPEGPEFLSVTPQRVRCYICGTYSESADHWSYRLKLTGHSAVCPACRSKAEHEIEEQTSAPNLTGAVLLGALAALASGAIWYACTRDRPSGEIVILSFAIGWLVGMAVVKGAGRKRGRPFQLVAATLAAAAIFIGHYLTLNHAVHSAAIEGSSSWLSPTQFFTLYGHLLAHGRGVGAPLSTVIAAWVAFVLPRADKLVLELPPKTRRWI